MLTQSRGVPSELASLGIVVFSSIALLLILLEFYNFDLKEILMLSDEDLVKYWRSESFPGSYRGARTFQILLKTDLGIDIPLNRIYKVLSKG